MDTKRPKRRTDKDYPYTIQITESKKYTVSFTGPVKIYAQIYLQAPAE